MECTGGTRRTVRTAVTRSVTRTATRTVARTVARIVAVVAAGAALVAGGIAAARMVPAGAPVVAHTGPTSVLAALPDGIGAANRAW
jgi:hypothetical protein